MGYVKDLRNLVGNRPLIVVGASVIVLNQDKQLLLHLRKDNQCWGLPGGSMELGESLEEVATREMIEETGLTPKKLKLLDIFSGEEQYYKLPHGDELYNVTANYICTEYTGELKIDDNESEGLQFFDINELPDRLNPPDIPVIHQFLTLN
ncbi:NUDIX hydrolase [Tenuibacillus multivorans]|uniref:ADP-ribose pyrophosphatase YjhB, NUDIX family n=1 Tax=Tenuibacillus multivorans TaxID=237069 RepID=A0A1G9WFP1_9BACI|nr:NUDIX hydrolase [Tenuibacillus multivorans]SDM83374.1 ADP-ribose pyrophosphatase YjhB, NUDIX family [Tenuibacillus multivorans]